MQMCGGRLQVKSGLYEWNIFIMAVANMLSEHKSRNIEKTKIVKLHFNGLESKLAP